jgi:phospholipid transport system transporter-binding protein
MSKCSIQHNNDGTVQLSGEMDLASTPGLYRNLNIRFNSDGRASIIDLAEIGKADSSGLALLLEWQAMARQQGHRLRIINTPDNLLSLAKLCEADKLMDISGR